MAIDDKRRITDFVEKPADPPAMPGKPDRALASMGIYIFNARYLYRELERDMADPDSSHDFGKDIIPKMVKAGVAAAHPFDLSCVGGKVGQAPYWRDVGTIDAYWDANIDLTATDPMLNLYDTHWPIWTYQPQLPPAKFVHNQDDRRGMAIESLVSGGCIVSGAVFRSVLFSQVRVHSYSAVNWSVLLPGVQVGRRRAPDARGGRPRLRIPDGMVIGEDAGGRRRALHRTRAASRWSRATCCAPLQGTMKVLHVAAEVFRWSRPAAWPTWWRRCRWRWPSRAPTCACCCPACRGAGRVQQARTVIDIGACFGALRVRLLLGRMPARSCRCTWSTRPTCTARRRPLPGRRRRGVARQPAALCAAGLGGRAPGRWRRRPALAPEVVHAHDWHAAMACAYIADHAGTEAAVGLHGAQPGLPGPVSRCTTGPCWAWRRASCRRPGWSSTASSAS
jgi:hypothetical protein